MRSKKCYLCSYTFEKFGKLWKCHNCGLGESTYKFNKSIYNKKYLKNYEKRAETLIGMRLNLLRLGMIAPYIPDTRRCSLLDYGCGAGTFLDYAYEFFQTSHGVDINPNIKKPSIFKTIPKNIKYDIVTMFDVIEHFENPIEVLKQIAKSMPKGGHIIIATPNFSQCIVNNSLGNWRHYKPKEHLFYYTNISLDILLKTCGFKRVEYGYRESLIRKGYDGLNILDMVAKKC